MFTYIEIEKINNVVLAGNGKDWFICYYDKKQYKYSRPTSEGTTVVSQDLDYISIGAKKCKTLKTARSWFYKEVEKNN